MAEETELFILVVFIFLTLALEILISLTDRRRRGP